MANRGKTANRKDALIGKIPAGAKRVKVIDEFGNERYRDIGDLEKGDEIQINAEGIPIVMRGKPGRKRTIEIKPTSDAAAQLMKEKDEARVVDPILQKAKADPESPDVLQEVILALGDEQASILFERKEAERHGKETSQLSNRRVAALKTLADTWLKRKDQVVQRGVDLTSPGFRIVFEYIMITVREAMASSGVQNELTDTVFAKVSREFDSDEWLAEAKRRMKASV